MNVTTIINNCSSDKSLMFEAEFGSNRYFVVVDRYSKNSIKFHLKPEVILAEYNSFCYGCLDSDSSFLTEVEKEIKKKEKDESFKFDLEFFYLYFQQGDKLYLFLKKKPNYVRKYIIGE